MRLGGPARQFAVVKSEKELLLALNFARQSKMPWYVIGEGSNLIVADRGYPGFVIRNHIEKFVRRGHSVTVGAGNNLLDFVRKLNSLGLRGIERMAGIPGTVGGAIYGSAGAYGNEIKDVLVKVRLFDGKQFRNFNKSQCRFGYRESIFKKHKDWVVTEATLRLGTGSKKELQRISREIIKLRTKKYPPGLRCPGSFFKNIKLSDIRPVSRRRAFLKKLNRSKIIYGKVPTGYLLETAGARGMRAGSILVAKHHANLIYNPGKGRASDVWKLAQKLKRLVKNKFGITIQEEVQYLGIHPVR